MKIAHIFNAVDKNHKNNTEIDSQEFVNKFWVNREKDDYSYDEHYNSDFARQYYHGLVPIENENIVSKYDKDKIDRLVEKLGSNLLLINGDFWGIQKFITDDLTTKKAPKILRSRSAMIQLITYAVIKEIKERFKDSEFLLFGAGKFMVLANSEDNYINKIKILQKELDKYFLTNFFGQNGFILSISQTTKEKILFENTQNIKMDLDNLCKDSDIKKLNKFNLLNCDDSDILQEPFRDAKKDDDICEFCHKRIESIRVDNTILACEICANQIKLGKKLTKHRYISIFSTTQKRTKDFIEIIKMGDKFYYASFENNADNLEGDIFDITHEKFFDYPKWSLNSYVDKDENGDIKTFDEYVENSSGLMALKADIDKLGDTFRNLYKDDFKKFNRLSREVDYFFSEYITSLIEKKQNVYTVFAGGDDLFLIGEYKEIMELAKQIRNEFFEFSLEKTTISMGLVMFKPSTPINFISNMVNEAEKKAKKERDSICLFDIPMKFDEFYEIEKDFEEVAEYLENHSENKSAFYYRLIELSNMKEHIDKDIKNALWKSKLNYMLKRNIKQKNNNSEIFDKLSNLIEKGEKFKPSIFLKIYKNKDKSKEKRDD